MIRQWPERNKRIKRGTGITHPRFFLSLKFVSRLRFDLYQSKSWAEDEYQWQYHISFAFLSFRVGLMKSCFAWSYYGTEEPPDMNKYRIVYMDATTHEGLAGHAHCLRHAMEIAREMPAGLILRGNVRIFRRENPKARRYKVYFRSYDGANYLRN